MGEFTPEFTGWPRNAQAVDVQPGRCPEVPFSRKLAKAASVGSRALPANLCLFSGLSEGAKFCNELGEAVGEPTELKVRTIGW